MKETPLALHLKVLPSSPSGDASVSLWWTPLLLGCSCSYSGRTAAYSPPVSCGVWTATSPLGGSVVLPEPHLLSNIPSNLCLHFLAQLYCLQRTSDYLHVFYSCIYTYDIYLTPYKNGLALWVSHSTEKCLVPKRNYTNICWLKMSNYIK